MPAMSDQEWFLLTTVDIVTAQDAEQCLRWYCLRWRIEDWHRVLKSVCRVEKLAHETAERLRRAIAINMVRLVAKIGGYLGRANDPPRAIS